MSQGGPGVETAAGIIPRCSGGLLRPAEQNNLTTGQVRRNLAYPNRRGDAAKRSKVAPEQTGRTTVDSENMAKQCLIIKQKAKPKFKVRGYNRCSLCGRDSGYFRYFGICRICLRESAHKGLLPGVVKSSW